MDGSGVKGATGTSWKTGSASGELDTAPNGEVSIANADVVQVFGPNLQQPAPACPLCC